MRREHGFWFLLLWMSCVISARGQETATLPATAVQPWSKPGWTLTFQDEFNDPAWDRGKWQTRLPGMVTRRDAMHAFVDDAFLLRSGAVHLLARRKTVQERGNWMPYASGMLTTRETFTQQFGYFEIRCRLPRGRGFRPACHLLPLRKSLAEDSLPRVDIFTALGGQPDRAAFGVEFRDTRDELRHDRGEFWQNGTVEVGDFAEAYHTFAVEWDDLRLIWYVDGKIVHQTRQGVPLEPLFLSVELGIGGPSRDPLSSTPDRSTSFPGVLSIDWIRIYEREQIFSTETGETE